MRTKINFMGWSRIIMDRLSRPLKAIWLLFYYRDVVAHLYKNFGLRSVLNYIYVTFFIRAEECGLGILDPIWKIFPFLAPYPPDIEVELTTICPLRCTICEHTYWPPKEGFLNRNMSFEQFKHIVDQFPHLKWINMTGEGSPFMNPDFLKMVEYVKRKWRAYVVIVYDFFAGMNERVAKKIIELGVERFWISFDGATKETYEKVRVNSNFDKVVKNIKMFEKIKHEMGSPIPELCFRFVFFKDNYHEMEKYIDLADSLGIKFVNFVGLLEFNEIKGWEYEPPQELVNRINAKCISKGIKIVWSHASHDPEIKVPLEYCVAWTEPYIYISGDVVPCCEINMQNKRKWVCKHSMGNVFKAHFKNIWYSPRFKKFRYMVVNRKERVPILCAGCRAFNTLEREKKYGVAHKI